MHKRASRYGSAVNSYDWLKFIALVIMTIDHIGAYLMDENAEWLRAIGRICVPMWFFLAGYSQSRVLGGEIIWLAIGLAIINYLTGGGIFPLNVLISIVICRYIVFWLKDRGTIDKRPFDIFIACIMLSLPSTMLFEYGTLGVCFAIMGDMIRRKLYSRDLIAFTILTTLLFLGYQLLWFEFNIFQNAFMVIGTFYTVWVLYHFEVKPSRWAPQSGILNYIVRFTARNTMHYYVYHRILFQIIGVLLGFSAFDAGFILNY